MFLPLALLLSVVILRTDGSAIQDNKDVAVRELFPGVGQYIFDPVLRNWTEAFQHCVELRGHLAVISSVAEKDSLLSLLIKYKVASIHLGFHDRFLEGVYTSVTDEPIDTGHGSNTWTSGYPLGGLENNCGAYYTDGIRDASCDTMQASICEYPRSLEYDYLPGHGYYKYHGAPHTWFEAYEICRSEGAHLYVIDTIRERDEVTKTYDLNDSIYIWIGVHRLLATSNSQFVTVFNRPWQSNSFTSWDSMAPSGTYLTHPSVSFNAPDIVTTQPITGILDFICEINE